MAIFGRWAGPVWAVSSATRSSTCRPADKGASLRPSGAGNFCEIVVVATALDPPAVEALAPDAPLQPIARSEAATVAAAKPVATNCGPKYLSVHLFSSPNEWGVCYLPTTDRLAPGGHGAVMLAVRER